MDRGHKIKISGGLFSKICPEGVWALLGRSIGNGRARLNKRNRGREGGGAPVGGEGGRGGAAIADEAEVAGEGREGATGHGFPNRKLLKKEEDEGNSLPASERLGKRPSCRAMAGGGELLRRARPGCLETSFSSENGWERAGGERKLTKATNAAKRAPNGGTTRGGACYSGDGSLRKDERSKGKEKREWGRGSARVRGGSPLQADTRWGGGDRGRGVRLRRFSRERERSRAAVWGRGRT